MSIDLTVEVDNEKALKKFRQLQQEAKKSTSSIVSESDRIDMAMRKIGTALGSLGIGFSLQQFAKQVATVRGEFQQLEVAFTTMLGSKAEADKLMARTVEFAAKTPFDLQGVASGTKQLLAFGSSADTVTDEMRMLGDIAAGLSIPIGDLVYLYGTTRTQGRMFTMDLRQFMGRGIPLAEELAKQFGVTKDKVSDLVTAGKVGFDEMHKALVSMTSEGGEFYNLMDAQSKTITGQMSNLEDSIQQMFNETGKQSEGTISKAIESASWLVENYEKVGRVLMDIVAAYGSYKAAIILVNTFKKVQLAISAAEVTALRLSAIAHKQVTAAMVMEAKAAKALNVAKYLTNPYVLAGAAVAGLAYGTYKLVTAKSAEERALDAANKQREIENNLIDERNEKDRTLLERGEENARIMKDASASTFDRVRANSELMRDYPELFRKYDEEKVRLMDIATLNREIAAITRERKIEDYSKIVTDAQSELDNLSKKVIKNFTGGKWVKYTAADGEEGDRLRAKIGLYKDLIKTEKELQEQERFKAMSDADKVKYLDDKIKIIDDTLKQQEKLPYPERETELIAERNSLVAHKDDILNPNKKNQQEEDEKKEKKLQNARVRAEQEANDAILEERKAHIKDKIKLLEFEKDAELAEIDKSIAETTDAEIKASLIRKRGAVESSYDAQISEAKIQEEIASRKEKADKEKEEKEHLAELLKEFATYNQRRAAIIKEYKDKEDSLYQTKDGVKLLKEGATEGNVSEIQKARDKELSDLSEQYFADDKTFKNWLESITNATISKLEQEKEALKAILATTNDPQTKAYIQYQIDAIENLQKTNKDNKGKSDTTKWSNLISAINDVGRAAQDALDNIEGMDSGLKKMLSDTVSLTSGVGNLVVAIKGVGAAAKGIDKASAILMVISAAVQAITTLFSAFSGGPSSMEITLGKFHELNDEIKKLNERAKLDNWEDTIFGGDSFGKAKNAIEEYQRALERLNKTFENILQGINDFGQFNGIDMALEQFMAHTASNVDEAIAYMSVQTRHSTWFRDAKYDTLQNQLPDLFDENGKIVSLEALKKFAESDLFKHLSKENQQFIKDLIADWELYEDALGEMRDYLSDVFGGLGDELTDSLVSAFENGTDASKAFAESVSNMLETFAKDMTKALFITPILKEAQKAMEETFADTTLSDEEKFERYAQIFNKATKDTIEQQDDAMAFLDRLQKIAEENGFNIFGGDAVSQSATSKGFNAMSQDTGDELNGRFTDIQGKVTDIRAFVLELAATGKLQQQETINIRDIMIQLNGNVADIRTFTQVLPEVRDTMFSMNKKLENL